MFGSTGANGGYSGEIKSERVTVVPLEAIPLTCGIGGVAALVSQSAPGTETTFGPSPSGSAQYVAIGGVSAAGGFGGYMGDNAPRTTCGGTANDGNAAFGTPTNGSSYGGQSSGFGAGGYGSTNNPAADGIDGAGGGGQGNDLMPGSGGNGVVTVTWGNDMPATP